MGSSRRSREAARFLETHRRRRMDGIKPVVDRYVEIWNETDSTRRKALIALTWTDDASYLDPLMSGDGPDGIDAMIQAVQERYPGHRFRRTGEVDDHHD